MQTVVSDGGRAAAPEAAAPEAAAPEAAAPEAVVGRRAPVTGGGDPSFWSPRGADGTVAAGWYLLPLRLFLGVTFVFAGLQKIANPAFFKAGSAGSIHAQLTGAARSSPLHLLLAHLVGASAAIGWVIAVAEVAVGLGMLVGLWTRIAALGGMLLSLSLFLAVSFHTDPYYLGSDIVFLFAWTPLLLAGAAGAPSFDTWLAVQAAADEVVDRAVRPGASGAPGPVEAGPDGAIARREVVSRGAAAGLVAAGVVALGGVAAAAGRVAGRTDADQPTTGSLTPGTTTPAAAGSGGSSPTASTPSGTSIGEAGSVPTGGSATFTVPSSGDPGLVIHQPSGQFNAFDAICPHAGCTVAYQASARIIACPCHGSEFNSHTGHVIRGPATYGLTRIAISKGPDGHLYVPE